MFLVDVAWSPHGLSWPADPEAFLESGPTHPPMGAPILPNAIEKPLPAWGLVFSWGRRDVGENLGGLNRCAASDEPIRPPGLPWSHDPCQAVAGGVAPVSSRRAAMGDGFKRQMVPAGGCQTAAWVTTGSP